MGGARCAVVRRGRGLARLPESCRRTTRCTRSSGAGRSSTASRPGFADFGAPTQHPLWVAVGTLLAPFGDAGARAMTLLAVLSFVVLLAATYHLGRTVFGPLAGALAAALLLTTAELRLLRGVRVRRHAVRGARHGGGGARGGAAAARRRRVGAARARRAAAPRGLGLRGGVRRVAVERRGPARPAADPRARSRSRRLLWALSDLVATGDPLFSWTYTTRRGGAARPPARRGSTTPAGRCGRRSRSCSRRRSRSSARSAWRSSSARRSAAARGGDPARGARPRCRRRSRSSCSAASRARCRATRSIAAVALLLFAGHLVAELCAARRGGAARGAGRAVRCSSSPAARGRRRACTRRASRACSASATTSR